MDNASMSSNDHPLPESGGGGDPESPARSHDFGKRRRTVVLWAPVLAAAAFVAVGCGQEPEGPEGPVERVLNPTLAHAIELQDRRIALLTAQSELFRKQILRANSVSRNNDTIRVLETEFRRILGFNEDDFLNEKEQEALDKRAPIVEAFAAAKKVHQFDLGLEDFSEGDPAVTRWQDLAKAFNDRSELAREAVGAFETALEKLILGGSAWHFEAGELSVTDGSMICISFITALQGESDLAQLRAQAAGTILDPPTASLPVSVDKRVALGSLFGAGNGGGVLTIFQPLTAEADGRPGEAIQFGYAHSRNKVADGPVLKLDGWAKGKEEQASLKEILNALKGSEKTVSWEGSLMGDYRSHYERVDGFPRHYGWRLALRARPVDSNEVSEKAWLLIKVDPRGDVEFTDQQLKALAADHEGRFTRDQAIEFFEQEFQAPERQATPQGTETD